MLIRTWNTFHGNTKPPQREAFLREAVELALADEPDVLCLQELPTWGLLRLASWTGYTVVPALAEPPSLGPLPSTAEIGRAVTSLNAGLLRSAFSGQGNAILVSPRLRLLEQHLCVLNPLRFRRAQAEWLSLRPLARLAWTKERRVCQVVRLAELRDTYARALDEDVAEHYVRAFNEAVVARWRELALTIEES